MKTLAKFAALIFLAMAGLVSAVLIVNHLHEPSIYVCYESKQTTVCEISIERD